MASTIRTDKIGPVSGSADFTLPTADGSAKSALITDGSKALSFATGTPSASNFLRGDGTWAAAGGGKVLQVIQTVKLDSATTTSTSFADIAGTDQAGAGSVWCVKITPAATSSKILIVANLNIGTPVSTHRSHFQLTGGNSGTYIGDANGSLIRTSVTAVERVNDAYGQTGANINYLDSPSTTSETTYIVQWRVSGDTAYLNRPVTIDANGGATSSSITVMEIGA